MALAWCKILRAPVQSPGIFLGPDWKKLSGQFNASKSALIPSRGFIATQIVCGGGPKQKEGPIWGRSLRKLGLMDKWKEAKKERIKAAIERQKLERERRAIRRELQLAMEERRRAEHERKLAELARAGIIVEGVGAERARKEDLLSALRTGQAVKEPWQEGLETITMKDIEETFETPVDLEALRQAGVFDEKGILGSDRGRDRSVTPERPGDNDWGLQPAPREDQVSLDDLREFFQGGASEAGGNGQAGPRFRSEIEEDQEERERKVAEWEGITVPENVGGDSKGGAWRRWEEGVDSEGDESGHEAEHDDVSEGEEAFSQARRAEERSIAASGSLETDLNRGLRLNEGEGQESMVGEKVDSERHSRSTVEGGEDDVWGEDEFDVLRERPVAAYDHAWSVVVEEGSPHNGIDKTGDGTETVVNPYNGWVRVLTTPKRTKKGKLVPLEKRGNSAARIKYLLETAHERVEAEEGLAKDEQELVQAS